MTLHEQLVELGRTCAKVRDLEQDISNPEIDALLRQWYAHRVKWVDPSRKEEHSFWRPLYPLFCPQFSHVKLDESDDFELVFETQDRAGDWMRAEVPLSFFADPDGWMERDKAGRITLDDWTAQKRERDVAELQRKDAEQLAAMEKRLKDAGYTVEKKVD